MADKLYEFNRAEDIAAFHSSGDVRMIWDIEHDTGPAQIRSHAIKAMEAMQNDPQRYRVTLPDGMKPGPHVGARAIVW